MALLPVLMDMIGDFDGDWKHPQKLFGDMPIMYVPRSRGRLNHCCPSSLQVLPKKFPDEFHTTINVQSFKPEEISVKVKGREILIEGKHEEREDEHGFISRQFSRRYVLPEAYDMETVATYLDADGKMIVKAQKAKPIEGPKERVIPIERVASSPQTNGEVEKKKEAEYKLEDVME